MSIAISRLCKKEGSILTLYSPVTINLVCLEISPSCMSFFVLWNKDEELPRPSSVNIPSARSVCYQSSLWNHSHTGEKHFPLLKSASDPLLTPAQNIMTDMLVACLQARSAVPHLEYFHIAKISKLLRLAADSKPCWLSLLEKFKYKTLFEKRLPDLLLCISDFRDTLEDANDTRRAEKASIQLRAYAGTLRTGELLRLMKLSIEPHK